MERRNTEVFWKESFSVALSQISGSLPVKEFWKSVNNFWRYG